MPSSSPPSETGPELEAASFLGLRSSRLSSWVQPTGHSGQVGEGSRAEPCTLLPMPFLTDRHNSPSFGFTVPLQLDKLCFKYFRSLYFLGLNAVTIF